MLSQISQNMWLKPQQYYHMCHVVLGMGAVLLVTNVSGTWGVCCCWCYWLDSVVVHSVAVATVAIAAGVGTQGDGVWVMSDPHTHSEAWCVPRTQHFNSTHFLHCLLHCVASCYTSSPALCCIISHHASLLVSCCVSSRHTSLHASHHVVSHCASLPVSCHISSQPLLCCS